jgi:signal transduction histidine kinase
MPCTAAERIKRLNNEIMETWEKRTIKEVVAAVPGNSLVLRDALPEFLNHIASALNTKIDRTKLRVNWDRKESSRIGRKHGGDRAKDANYTIDQLIFEYSILRQVICELMEQEAPLSDVEREVIVCAIEQAVNDAATEFSEIFSDIQERLTTTLAHDLRTPISAAKLGAQLILKKPTDATSCSTLATGIVSSLSRIDQMIHDLLDGSKLRAGELLSMPLADCDLDEVLKKVVNEMSLSDPTRIIYKSVGPVIGQWSENGIRRVIDNLVSNALKFSPPKSCISIQLHKTEKDVEISVHNFGDPITPEEKLNLFENFRRAKNSQGKTGWGLGLTVVKGITAAHGGKIEVESSSETGTVFKVTLPLRSQKSVQS